MLYYHMTKSRWNINILLINTSNKQNEQLFTATQYDVQLVIY